MVIARSLLSVDDLDDAGRSLLGMLPVPFPPLVELDAPVRENLRGADAAPGDHRAVGQHHAVREVDGAVLRAGAGQCATTHLATGELGPHQVAFLAVQRDGHLVPRIGGGPGEPPAVIVDHSVRSFCRVRAVGSARLRNQRSSWSSSDTWYLP